MARFKTFYLCSRSIPKAFLVGSFDLQLKTILIDSNYESSLLGKNKHNKIYHLESRWHNSHVLDCIGLSWLSWPFTNPPFESCAIYFHHGVNQNKILLAPTALGKMFFLETAERKKTLQKSACLPCPLRPPGNDHISHHTWKVPAGKRDTVDGRYPKQPPVIYETLWYFGIFSYINWWSPDFWTINSICLVLFG